MTITAKYFFEFDSWEAGVQIGRSVADMNPVAVMVFVTEQYTPLLVMDGIYTVLPYSVPVFGAVGKGVVSTDKTARFGVSIYVLHDTVPFSLRAELHACTETGNDGIRAFRKLHDSDLRAVLALAPNDVSGHDRFLREIADACAVPFVGGTVGDPLSEDTHTVFLNGRCVDDAVLTVGLYGDVAVRTAISLGWDDDTDTAVVTEADDRTVKRIGDRTAVDFYRDFFGDAGEIRECLLFPVAVSTGPHAGGVFFPIRWNIRTGEVVFPVEITAGTEISVAVASPEQLIADAQKRFSAFNENDFRMSSLFMFNSHARYQILGNLCQNEKQFLPDSDVGTLPVTGVSTNSELYCDGTDGASVLHTNGATVCLAVGDTDET